MSSTSETQPSETSQTEAASLDNSPIAYGLGSFGLESAYKVFIGFYIFYYVDVLGLVVALAAVINIVFAIWDAVNDPLVGYLSDNTRTRWGRRRPWLLAGLPFYVILLVLTYAIPEVFRSGQSLFWYALVVFLLSSRGSFSVGSEEIWSLLLYHSGLFCSSIVVSFSLVV